ncbi:MAG: TonB-dependent receptor [Dysgonamonadaceae bacterium]|jgi:TonB-linked SusC/RagA family outer membrane protein|nr:TonB-dependent receptor [Dysgonamonadaceae bacterium]
MKRKNCKIDPRLTGFLFSLMLFFSSAVYAQNTRMVKGQVVDSNNESIIGASVRLKEDASVGTVTDMDGKFSINVPDNSQTLVISYLGMITKEVNTAGKNQLTIVMQEDAKQLEEVIVVGYGKQKKESVVGAISQTSGDVLKRAGGVSNVGAALTGNLPGVVTMSSTGMPGEEDPKIIIRGQSTWNNSDPLVLVDGIERPMKTVDITSVESISVLKDASATAVFGVRGANGVVLITTKRGKEGKASIDIGVNTTLKAPSRLPNKYDSYDALRIRNMAIERELTLVPSGWADYTPQNILNKYRNPANIEESERYPNVDWADVLFKDYAMSNNVNINFSGGTSFVKYFASADLLHEGDLFESWDNNRGYSGGYGFDRTNVRSNFDFQLTRTTALKANIAGSHGIKKTPWAVDDNNYDMWISAYVTPPDAMLPRYSDGTWGYYPKDEVGAFNSARAIATSGVMARTTTSINTDFALEQELGMLLKGLNFKATFSFDNSFMETERGINDLYHEVQSKWINPETGEAMYKQSLDGNLFDFQEGVKWSTQAGHMDDGATYRKLFYQGQLNYARVFGKHDVTAMGLAQREEFAKGSELPHYREEWIFRTTYNFDKKYFAEYNCSYNGSEKFAPKYRFAFFQSGAIGWMLSEEKFINQLDFLDMLKLRASYGTVGDDNVGGRWLYMTEWAYGNTAKIGENNNDRSPYTWYRESKVGNPETHWEKATKSNIGADFSVLNGLISGNVDYFNDYRTDILTYDRAIPSYYGASAPAANLGKVRTKGYEIELKFNYVFGNGLRIWANGNMTHVKDKIIDADNPELLPDYQKSEGKQIGQTYSYLDYGYYNTWDELYASTILNTNDNQKLPGDYHIIDYNGDGVIDTYDRVPYAYPERPQNTYNGTFGFEWKGISAFVQFYGVNNITRQVVFSDFPTRKNLAYNQGTYWTKDNTNADVPMSRWLATGVDESSSGARYLYDGSYIRLKNMEIAYTFENAGWLKKMGVKTLRLYLNGNNLWLWTQMPDDRESNFSGTGWASQGAYPTVKRYNLGLNITF